MKTLYLQIILCMLISFNCQEYKLLRQIKKEIKKSYDSKRLLNPKEFEISRNLLFEKLTFDILESDTIIIMEYFYDGTVGYYCTVYKSYDNSVVFYRTVVSIKHYKVIVDSLVVAGNSDRILNLVLEEKYDEIKERGTNSRMSPPALLIINIATKDKKKKKYNFTTLITINFPVYTEEELEWFEKLNKIK